MFPDIEGCEVLAVCCVLCYVYMLKDLYQKCFSFYTHNVIGI